VSSDRGRSTAIQTLTIDARKGGKYGDVKVHGGLRGGHRGWLKEFKARKRTEHWERHRGESLQRKGVRWDDSSTPLHTPLKEYQASQRSTNEGGPIFGRQQVRLWGFQVWVHALSSP